METYDREMEKHYAAWRQEGITHVIYGDIFLEDLRAYREKQLVAANLTAIFPLWKANTRALLDEFWQAGFKTMIVCANQKLADFAGKILDQVLVSRLPVDVDPCGENGEFHTFVFEGPIFRNRLKISTGETIFRTYHSPDSGEETGFFYTDIFAEDQKL
ncbi:MAG: ATP-binding protein, partial [Mucilaginibacter polytrichastri]|nr:ATP-binding protein [Mucilaginibacter polytrichastri]